MRWSFGCLVSLCDCDRFAAVEVWRFGARRLESAAGGTCGVSSRESESWVLSSWVL